MTGELKIPNIDNIIRAMQQLPIDMQKKLSQKAINKAAKIVLEDARRKVNVRTGALKKSLAIRIGKSKGYAVSVRVIALQKKGGYHANLIELGTAPHIIPKAVINGKVYYNVKHPGTSKEPFMRPALIENKNNVIHSISDDVLKFATLELQKAFK